jgi:hypothetical protein
MQSIIGVRLFLVAMFLDTKYEFFNDSSIVESFSQHSYRMTLLRLKKTLQLTISVVRELSWRFKP